MDRNEFLNSLTDEQRERAEKLEALLSDEKNLERIKAMTSMDEAFAFYEENGISLTDEQKEEIRKFSEEMAKKHADGELSEEELEAVAGGWSWFSFGTGAVFSGILGAVGYAFALTNPVGWVVGTIAAAAVVGSYLGYLEVGADLVE